MAGTDCSLTDLLIRLIVAAGDLTHSYLHPILQLVEIVDSDHVARLHPLDRGGGAVGGADCGSCAKTRFG